MTEQKLISNLKEGDPEAFSDLYSKYRDKVFFFSCSYLKSRDKAEDIVHDVFLKVWENRSRLNEHSSFNNYLFRVTKNTVLNCIRKANYEIVYRQIHTKLPADSYRLECHVLDSVICNDLQSYINREIEKLPAAMRKIYSLSRIQFLSNPEIAAKQNLSIRTVENQIYRAVSKLKSKFIEEGMIPHCY